MEAEYEGGGGAPDGLGGIMGYGGGGSAVEAVLLWYKLSACICCDSCCWTCGPFWTTIGCLPEDEDTLLTGLVPVVKVILLAIIHI